MKKIKVAFIYHKSNIFLSGNHFDNTYYHFYINALKRNEKFDLVFDRLDAGFDAILDSLAKKEIQESDVKHVLEKLSEGISINKALCIEKVNHTMIEEKIHEIIKNKERNKILNDIFFFIRYNEVAKNRQFTRILFIGAPTQECRIYKLRQSLCRQ